MIVVHSLIPIDLNQWFIMAEIAKQMKKYSHKKEIEVVSIFDDRRKRPSIQISPEIERRDSSFVNNEQWYLRIDPIDDDNQVAS